MRTSRLPVLLVLLIVGSARGASAQGSGDRAGVERAVLDYVEGFYEGDTAKLVRSVHPNVVKYGFFIPRDSSRYAGEAMPYAEFLAYAKRVKARGQPAPADAPKRIEIFDVQDQTASAKLTAIMNRRIKNVLRLVGSPDILYRGAP